ncbi:NAD(P)-dependent oxidoreductase [Texcoconibacillus texcoconensis]|uniref:Phosphoglycerate dehydrogenase-like enzyme n=1 Tax=Texcoconibacillus texcoconensis TaxID=1095777 RepID=A0A840QU73_9BACI|nr:phosphoglycerate dehydrogenase-like enzyme [Texcoconibacillus texcoconensis]
MQIVTTAKIRRDLRQHLSTTYPNIDFDFNASIEEANQALPTAEVLITYGEDLKDEHIERAKNLTWIMVISAGIDQLPAEAIKERGIIVTNVRGIHGIPMAEYSIAMMLQVARQTKTLIEKEKKHEWDRHVKMTELHNKTLGVLGAGAIGSEIARLGNAFSMKTIGMNRSGRDVNEFDQIVDYANLDTLLQESDFIVSVLPRTPDTDGLLDMSAFKNMKENAVFINIGRGNVIVEDDLLSALDQGEFAHAVLDVFDEEPLPYDHPFWTKPEITVTPHLSGISPEYQPRAIEIFEHNLSVYQRGEGQYQNLVDLKKGY